MVALHLNEIGRFIINDRNSEYFCCDYFEVGSGYLFTDCGGNEVLVDKNKLQTERSQ
jgi:hypothetical protein